MPAVYLSTVRIVYNLLHSKILNFKRFIFDDVPLRIYNDVITRRAVFAENSKTKYERKKKVEPIFRLLFTYILARSYRRFDDYSKRVY